MTEEKYLARAGFKNGNDTIKINEAAIEVAIRKINERLENNDKNFVVYIDLVEE
ncbi:MAG: hypothetical protein J6Y02_19595 [Pseudobutyrivibrio sp.]|nr:hypothetical protein [Pseudobutyrivibrio sp.]